MNIRFHAGIGLSLSLCFLLSSCSIQFEKRRYTKGYHYSVVKRPKRTGNEVHAGSPKKQPLPVSNPLNTKLDTSLMPRPETPDELLISEKNSPKITGRKKPAPRIQITPIREVSDTCDRIFLKNGDEISAIVEEVSDKQIKYRKCGQEDGPLYILETEDLLHILFTNGDNYVPKQLSGQKSAGSDTDSEEGLKRNLTSLILAAIAFIFLIISSVTSPYVLIGTVLFSIAAIVLGIMGIQYKYRGMGIAGMVAGFVFLCLALLFLLVILL